MASVGDSICCGIDSLAPVITFLILFCCAVAIAYRVWSKKGSNHKSDLQGKLDQHLLGDTVGDLGKSKEPPKEPCYFPVLSDNLVGRTLREESKASAALDRIIKEQTAQKLEATLTDFFQPLITNFRQGKWTVISFGKYYCGWKKTRIRKTYVNILLAVIVAHVGMERIKFGRKRK